MRRSGSNESWHSTTSALPARSVLQLPSARHGVGRSVLCSADCVGNCVRFSHNHRHLHRHRPSPDERERERETKLERSNETAAAYKQAVRKLGMEYAREKREFLNPSLSDAAHVLRSSAFARACVLKLFYANFSRLLPQSLSGCRWAVIRNI